MDLRAGAEPDPFVDLRLRVAVRGRQRRIETSRKDLLQPATRCPELSGHEDPIPRPGIAAALEVRERTAADGRDVDRNARFRTGRVASDERGGEALRKRPVTLDELQGPVVGSLPGQGDRQQCRYGASSHGRHIAQIDGQAFSAQFPGRGCRAQEMHSFGQQVRRENQGLAAAERQYGAVVPDPLEPVVGECGEKCPYLVDESEFRHVF